ncbi:unnamed protein product [Urochloa decumbens]|uniref:F-box domain-containing protein n=1 Tax=Urochloa decumbens TaxID=240449 RepID=A0ABC9FNW2_9POAL
MRSIHHLVNHTSLAVYQAPPVSRATSPPLNLAGLGLGPKLVGEQFQSENRSASHYHASPRAATTAMAPPPPPPPLMEELEEEVLLRFPPHEPALLIRASLVCKRWRRLLSGPAFRRRFRELHRTPPILGLLCNIADGDSTACFVPMVSAFRVPDADLGLRRALDARHGRVLLQCRREGSGNLAAGSALMVWDPITGEQQELSIPLRCMFSWTAAILCAACDHLDCHRRPFLVVFVGSGSGKAFICTYSSDAGIWSEPIAREQPNDYIDLMSSVLVGNALYFGFLLGKLLLKYDLETRQMSVIGLPFANSVAFWRPVVLHNGLELATMHGSKLCMWSQNGVQAGWIENRVIELETLLPSDAFFTSHDHDVVGFADGIGVIFLRERSGHAIFTIDLKTCKVKKVSEGKNIHSVVPYMSFYTPALGAACTDEGSSVWASGA